MRPQGLAARFGSHAATMRAMQRGCREEEPPPEQVAVELERARDEEEVREVRRAPRLPRAQKEPANNTSIMP